MRATLRRILFKYAQFCIVGLSGVLVDIGIVWLLHYRMGAGVVVAKCVAAEVALLNNFLWNEKWTFSGARYRSDSVWCRLLRFHAVCVIGIGLALVILMMTIRLLGYPVWVSNLIAIVAASIWNFGINMSWSWREKAIDRVR